MASPLAYALLGLAGGAAEGVGIRKEKKKKEEKEQEEERQAILDKAEERSREDLAASRVEKQASDRLQFEKDRFDKEYALAKSEADRQKLKDEYDQNTEDINAVTANRLAKAQQDADQARFLLEVERQSKEGDKSVTDMTEDEYVAQQLNNLFKNNPNPRAEDVSKAAQVYRMAYGTFHPGEKGDTTTTTKKGGKSIFDIGGIIGKVGRAAIGESIKGDISPFIELIRGGKSLFAPKPYGPAIPSDTGFTPRSSSAVPLGGIGPTRPLPEPINITNALMGVLMQQSALGDTIPEKKPIPSDYLFRENLPTPYKRKKRAKLTPKVRTLE